uniref:Yippee domain-containing protein n=1 Tax=Loa loa TaxID=7209 RepID=A0A1I7W3Y5_LOALO
MMVHCLVIELVIHDEYGHYETFGHAYLVRNGVCARFVNRYHKAKTICGGFRVLSRSNNNGNLAFKFVQARQANIHEAVEYRNKQVAKIVSWTKNEMWYGSASMREAFAECIDYENEYVKISHIDDPFFYRQNVYILVSCNPDDPEAGKAQYYQYYQTPNEQIVHNQRLRFEQQRQRILRHKQQLREQQIKRELQNREHEEELRYEQQQYEQKYQMIDEQQQQQQQQHHHHHQQQQHHHQQQQQLFAMDDDEPDEKWKFYQHSRRF